MRCCTDSIITRLDYNGEYAVNAFGRRIMMVHNFSKLIHLHLFDLKKKLLENGTQFEIDKFEIGKFEIGKLEKRFKMTKIFRTVLLITKE